GEGRGSRVEVSRARRELRGARVEGAHSASERARAVGELARAVREGARATRELARAVGELPDAVGELYRTVRGSAELLGERREAEQDVVDIGLGELAAEHVGRLGRDCLRDELVDVAAPRGARDGDGRLSGFAVDVGEGR